MNTDQKALIKYSYNQLAKRNLTCRYLFDDWKHLDNINNRLKPNSKILDVGCGSGIPIAKYFLDKGHNVTGIDISEDQIQLARKNLAKGEFIEMDMENITFPESSFDAVVSFYTIYHLPKTLHLNLLKKLHKILKNKGLLMITMGSRDWEETTEEYEDIKLFWSHWGKEKNLEILWEAGFELVYEEKHKSGGDEHLIIFAMKSGNAKDDMDTNKASETIYQS